MQTVTRGCGDRHLVHERRELFERFDQRRAIERGGGAEANLQIGPGRLGCFRRRAGQRGDAPHARRQRLFLQDHEVVRLTGAAQMGSAAELDRELAPLLARGIGEDGFQEGADADHAHGIGIAFAEDGSHARDRPRLLEGNLLRVDHELPGDRRVDPLLNVLQLLVAQRGGPAEVEPQPIGRHQRSPLFDVIAEQLAQARD